MEGWRVDGVGGDVRRTLLALSSSSKTKPGSGKVFAGSRGFPFTLLEYGVPERPKSGHSGLFPPPSALRKWSLSPRSPKDDAGGCGKRVVQLHNGLVIELRRDGARRKVADRREDVAEAALAVVDGARMADGVEDKLDSDH